MGGNIYHFYMNHISVSSHNQFNSNFRLTRTPIAKRKEEKNKNSEIKPRFEVLRYPPSDIHWEHIHSKI